MNHFEFIHPYLNKNINNSNAIIHLHSVCYEWQDIENFFNDFDDFKQKQEKSILKSTLEWVGYIHYEVGHELINIIKENQGNTNNNKEIIAEFVAYELTENSKNSKTVKNHIISKTYLTGAFNSKILQEQKNKYIKQIEQIQQYIIQGHTYQINHTFSLPYKLIGNLKGLFEKLYPEQKTIYGCFLRFKHQEIACFSPELLVEKQQNKLICKPMKGTASVLHRSKESVEQELHNVKNHAENVMIVDLLRHDLNRLTHDVQVTELFGIEHHQTLAQMTSTIVANFEKKSMPPIIEVLKTLFPCGSIVGAPKKRSMEIIDEIEKRQRGVYTGAIGWGNSENYQFTVPIRTFANNLQSENPENQATETIYYNTGSGITIESDAQQEWQECLLKTKFLEKAAFPENFGIIETMKGFWDFDKKEVMIPLLQCHLTRLHQSCLELFDLEFNIFHEQFLIENLNKYQYKKGFSYRIRLQVHLKDNKGLEEQVLIQIHELEELNELDKIFDSNFLSLLSIPEQITDEKIDKQLNKKQVLINSDKYIINENNWSQKHKTTVREHYNSWYVEGEKQGFYDVIALNSKGNIAESCRHIVILWDKNRKVWITPPQTDGALNSVYLAWLKKQKNNNFNIIEESISVEQLLDASKNSLVYVANAIRGAVLVEIV